MNRIALFTSAAAIAAAMAGATPAVTAEVKTPLAAAAQAPSPVSTPAPVDVDADPDADGDAGTIIGVAADLDRQANGDADATLDAARAALDRRIQTIADRLEAATPGTAEMDAVDVALVAVIEEEQAALAGALGRLGGRDIDESDLGWRTVDVHGKAMLRLVQLRIKARDFVSEERRRALISFGRVGLQQAAREARTASSLVRYHVVSRRHSIDEVPQMARDLFTVGAALSRLILVVAVLAAALWVRRRWRGWLEGLRTSTFRSLASVASKRRTQRLFRWGATVAPWGLLLITIAALRWALGPAAATTEVSILLALLTVYGVYRLAVDIVTTMLMGVALHYGLDATDERRAMLLSSVRLVLRVGAIMVLIQLISRGMGQGFLSALVLKFAWLVVLAAVLVELFRWRGVMIDTFLRLQPKGRLSATLRATRAHWYGAFIAPGALVWLAGRGIATVTREFALGFEQTQRALAFLFRQRVQRQAELTGYAEGVVAELPVGLVEAFREEAVETGPLVVPNFPGLGVLHEILTQWRDSGARGSYLLTGERGVGKTTWLNQIRRDDLEIHRILLGWRVTNPSDLCARLAELLEVDAGPDAGPRELGRALFDGPKRVVVLDMSQHLFLTSVGGYEAFKAFATLVNRTCNNVFWLCSMSAYAWRHLRAVRPDATVFRTRRHLAGWNEEQIAELIRTRCAASGIQFNFADLVVDRLEGVSLRSSLIESAEGYSRLLWDYSDGNPRAALHFFLRSLDPDRDGTVRVRLFKAPDVDLLEDGGQDGLFVLAAIVTHESINLEDLVEVTRFDRAQTFIHLDRLLEVGAISLENDMYRVSTTWHRAGVRLLRRRNLLPA